MKLGLINPRGAYFSNNKKVGSVWNNSEVSSSTNRLYTCPNLGLLTIAALSKDYFSEITYIDENFDNIDYDECFDLIGISAMTNQINRAYLIADKFRAKGITVAIGGVHATVLPEEATEHADVVIIGEAEGLWEEFLGDFKNKSFKRFYKRDNNDGIDITKTPVPMFDLLNIKNHKIIPIQTSRGCPHNCEFCSSPKIFGKKYRFKTVEQIVNEVNALKRVWDKPYIYFSDDNMTVNKKFTKELLKELVPLKIRWQGYSDISIADDDELLELLSHSGCTNLLFGLESLSTSNLGVIDKWKMNQLNKYSWSIEKIQSFGIGVFGSFILGLDNDTTGVFKDVSSFIIDNNLYGAIITVQTPLPGARLYDRLKEEGRIFNDNWDNYTLFDVVSEPKNMTVKELEDGLEWVYQQVYSKDAINSRSRYFKNIVTSLRLR
ncbi:MAG TPA: radical SAM protein [Clostridia bacterium]